MYLAPVEKIIAEVPAELEELIPGYLSNRQEDLRKLHQALQEEDFKAIYEIGHNLKGTGSGYGFNELTRIGSELELAASEPSAEKILKLLEVLKGYLENVEVQFVED